jgi:23S rRNA pseudouridine1911/1915/1917 synthase
MTKSEKNFKTPPKRYQPRGLSILHEDHDILVVDKMSGLLTVSTEKVRENTAYYLLNIYVRKGNQKSRNRVFIVHRLDKDTSGIIIFAKNEKAKRFLQDEWHGFKKKYYAVVHGTLSKKEGVITSYLAENRAHKMYSVVDPEKGKLSKTGFKVLRESKKYSLLEIDLLTGRKNQIRVHFSEKGFPVAGDKMYGEKDKGIKRLTLHAASITILHPATKEKMTFETTIPAYFNSLVNS